MEEHLSPLGASFLYLEEPTTAMHVGSVLVVEPGPDGFDEDRFSRLVEARVWATPRYRQKVRELPGRFATPYWVEAADFDLSYHLRHSALPRPGTQEQLQEFVARILSRPLDRSRPLWELYVVEGLAGGRVALVTKTHQALVDGVSAVDIAQLLLDDDPDARPMELAEPEPRREPSDVELLIDTAIGFATRPNRWAGFVVGSMTELMGAAGRVASQTRSVASAVARTATDPAPHSPLNVRVGAARRVCFAELELDRFRAVRDDFASVAPGRTCTVTDVILASLSGALRTWLQSRGEPVHGGARVRALVPVSVTSSARVGEPGSSLRACFVDLPVGEASPSMRLEQIAFQMRRELRGGRAVGGRAIAEVAGFAPTTLHHLGAQLGNAASRRFFNLVVTNVPGPQHPLYVAGHRMAVSYPIIPLALGQALSVGLTSYDGRVGVGLNGDRASMHDLDAFPDYLEEALEQLAEAVTAEAAGLGGDDEEEPVGSVRVYLAVGEEGLRRLANGETLEPGDYRAAAVTPSVREAFPGDDEEELEYDAELVAADLVGRRWPAARVVVAAVDLPPSAVREREGEEDVVPGYEVVASVPIDAARLVALHAAEAGAGEDDELLWYDVTELGRLASGEI